MFQCLLCLLCLSLRHIHPGYKGKKDSAMSNKHGFSQGEPFCPCWCRAWSLQMREDKDVKSKMDAFTGGCNESTFFLTDLLMIRLRVLAFRDFVRRKRKLSYLWSALEGYPWSLKTLVKGKEELQNSEGIAERKGTQAYIWVRIHQSSSVSGFAMPLQRRQSNSFSYFMSLMYLSQKHKTETLER